MLEHDWHKKVREEIFQKLQPNAYSSHSEISKLELYRDSVKRQNCLSDADIVVFDPISKKIMQIIEIETQINPKKIIGIVLATHLCSFCRIKKENHLLDNISLKIVYKKSVQGSKKDMKLEVIKQPLKEIIANTKGCLSDFAFEEHD